MVEWTKETLAAFEQDIADDFEKGNIAAPVHLRGGNENFLIGLFNSFKITKDDWLCTTWASHLEVLLKGVPPEQVKKAILNRKSITLCFSEHRVISSAIVGSIAPLSIGIGESIKMRGGKERVFCFIGDMSTLGGQAQESFRYARNKNLPVTFIVADNGLSVKTPTYECWGLKLNEIEEFCGQYPNIVYYNYKNCWPHSGIGKRVNLW